MSYHDKTNELGVRVFTCSRYYMVSTGVKCNMFQYSTCVFNIPRVFQESIGIIEFETENQNYKNNYRKSSCMTK
jgi:hypothetical protein